MKTSRTILALIMFFFLGACIITGPKSKNSKLTDALREDSYSSVTDLGPILIAERKILTRKISGRIYCGDGMNQVPANKANIDIKNKNKLVRSATTEVDGTYSFSAPFDSDGEYKMAMSARCGKLESILPREINSDLTNHDFWIK